MSDALQRWARVAGLICGPGCWGASTQIAYTVASQACDSERAILTPVMLGLIVVAGAGAIVSAFSARPIGGEWFDLRGGAAHRLLAAVSCGAGLLFALVIANQFAAMLMVEKCLR